MINHGVDLNLQALNQFCAKNDHGIMTEHSSDRQKEGRGGYSSSRVQRSYRVDPNIETLGPVAGKIIQNNSSIPSNGGDAPSGSDQNQPIASPGLGLMVNGNNIN